MVEGVRQPDRVGAYNKAKERLNGVLAQELFRADKVIAEIMNARSAALMAYGGIPTSGYFRDSVDFYRRAGERARAAGDEVFARYFTEKAEFISGLQPQGEKE